MKQAEFLSLMHRRLAQTAIGNSVIRNQGAKGLAEIARGYMEENVELDVFFKTIDKKSDYEEFLNKHTNALLAKFPSKGKSWGAARKALNLFFRNLTYNKYFADKYQVSSDFGKNNIALQNLELPLDSYVGKGLRSTFDKELPGWPGLKSLTKNVSDAYQEKALELSKQKNIARVHLDLVFWRN